MAVLVFFLVLIVLLGFVNAEETLQPALSVELIVQGLTACECSCLSSSNPSSCQTSWDNDVCMREISGAVPYSPYPPWIAWMFPNAELIVPHEVNPGGLLFGGIKLVEEGSDGKSFVVSGCVSSLEEGDSLVPLRVGGASAVKFSQDTEYLNSDVRDVCYKTLDATGFSLNNRNVKLTDVGRVVNDAECIGEGIYAEWEEGQCDENSGDRFGRGCRIDDDCNAGSCNTGFITSFSGARARAQVIGNGGIPEGARCWVDGPLANGIPGFGYNGYVQKDGSGSLVCSDCLGGYGSNFKGQVGIEKCGVPEQGYCAFHRENNWGFDGPIELDYRWSRCVSSAGDSGEVITMSVDDDGAFLFFDDVNGFFMGKGLLGDEFGFRREVVQDLSGLNCVDFEEWHPNSYMAVNSEFDEFSSFANGVAVYAGEGGIQKAGTCGNGVQDRICDFESGENSGRVCSGSHLLYILSGRNFILGSDVCRLDDSGNPAGCTSFLIPGVEECDYGKVNGIMNGYCTNDCKIPAGVCSQFGSFNIMEGKYA